MTLGAESSQSGNHVTTIIQILPWSVWLPPQRFIKSGSYLEPWIPFLTYAPDFSSYALDFSYYTLDFSSYALDFSSYALDFSSYALDFSSYALDFSSLYAFKHLYTKPKGYSAWVSADCSLVKVWGWIILGSHLVARSNQLARRSQTSSLV